MRLLAIGLILSACLGCSSTRKDVLLDGPKKRDYTSLNKRSFKFLVESMREKQNRKQSLDSYKGVAAWNRRSRKESLAFLRSSLAAEQKENWREMIDLIRSQKVTAKQRAASIRFGFLDSGE